MRCISGDSAKIGPIFASVVETLSPVVRWVLAPRGDSQCKDRWLQLSRTSCILRFCVGLYIATRIYVA